MHSDILNAVWKLKLMKKYNKIQQFVNCASLQDDILCLGKPACKINTTNNNGNNNNKNDKLKFLQYAQLN